MSNKIKMILDRNAQILLALDVLEFKGYNQCKTYTNIVEAMRYNSDLLNEILDELNKKEEKQE